LYAVPITNSVSIQPEISYTTKGAELSYNNAFTNGTLRLKQIILKFLYYSFFQSTNALNVHAGPYAAYMVGGKTTNDSNLFTSETKNTNDFKGLTLVCQEE
jgi:hypothetical protein